MRIWLGALCAAIVGLTVGGAIAQHRLAAREENFRAWCESVRGQVHHKIEWQAGPLLVTICNR